MYRFTFCNLIFLHIPCNSSHNWRAEPSSSTPLLSLVQSDSTALRTYLYPIITTRLVTRRALTFNCSPSHLGGCTSCPRIGPLLAVLRSSSPLRCSSACHINRLPGLHSRSAPLHFISRLYPWGSSDPTSFSWSPSHIGDVVSAHQPASDCSYSSSPLHCSSAFHINRLAFTLDRLPSTSR